ncbi:DNA-binding PadR family transcriptional regulator [Nocardiopsis mwathae]|uniref:DNA-binding PadR family transcriptional regulator n=1 Tax=Nocardiopsis mwathae TaxID=1472723 RepID=A0A7W9YGR1_9ACTN|nr:PadR family transcriptional regulator [Nocardiopsis mwathae]MBB6171660.1 DNA-binding PadR family transcriptional regulator [Nocardiopsis mwathae]
MSLRHALLGMLAYEPSSGYDLKKRFDGDLGEYAWHAPHTRIYPELAKLADEGLIEVAGEGARGRRTYAVTDAGRAELRRWLFTPQDEGPARNVQVLRLFLLSALEPDDARQLLRMHADDSDREAHKLSEIVAALDADATPGEPPQFGRVAAEFGLRMHRARRDWARWALDRMG